MADYSCSLIDAFGYTPVRCQAMLPQTHSNSSRVNTGLSIPWFQIEGVYGQRRRSWTSPWRADCVRAGYRRSPSNKGGVLAKSRPSVQKRNLESKKLDRKANKAARRAEREADKEARAALIAAGEDPDLAGITAGPQEVSEDVLNWTPEV